MLTEAGGRRLYRFDLVGEGREADIMPLLLEVGGVHLELVATEAGWRNRTRFPDRESLERVHRFCEERDVGFELHRVWEAADSDDDPGSGLSERQRRTLVEAVESGYLEIPRSASLAELGDRLGVSESATSERFRRAVRTLVEEQVLD